MPGAENEYQAHEFNNCLYVKVDLNDPNRYEQSTRDGTSKSMKSVNFWEPFPSRVQRPLLHAVGYENLPCSAACRSQNDALHVHFALCDTGFNRCGTRRCEVIRFGDRDYVLEKDSSVDPISLAK